MANVMKSERDAGTGPVSSAYIQNIEDSGSVKLTHSSSNKPFATGPDAPRAESNTVASTEAPSEILEEEEDWNDICKGFEFSVAFFVVVAAAFIVLCAYIFILYRNRRKHQGLYAFDILFLLLFITAEIKFIPGIWRNLQYHGIRNVSQSGCKLMAFTMAGMSSVITFLITCLLIYVWLGFGQGRATRMMMSTGWLGRMDWSGLDSGLKRHLGWFLLLLFAIEGSVGMVPAIYMDLGRGGKACNATQSVDISATEFMHANIWLQVIVPYLLPFLLWTYLLVSVGGRVLSAGGLGGGEDKAHQEAAKTILIVAASFMATFLPQALVSVSVIPASLNGARINWRAVCIFEGITSFMEDAWFVYTPILVILRDAELSPYLPAHPFKALLGSKTAAPGSLPERPDSASDLDEYDQHPC